MITPATEAHVRDMHAKRAEKHLAIMAATKGVIVASLRFGNDSLEAARARAHLHAFDKWPRPGRGGK